MRRRLISITSVISLLLCLATMVLWVRSYTGTVVIVQFQRGQARWHVALRRGRISVNNQPQLDWEQCQRLTLNGQLRDAEIRQFYAASAFQRRWLQRYNGWRFEEVPQPDAETRQLMDKLIVESQRVARLTSTLKLLATPLSRHVTPLPLLAVLFLALPGICLWRRRAIARGLCGKCGYDLTGNTSGVCPECGTPVGGNAGAPA